MAKSYHYNPAEEEFIRDHWMTHTDEWIAGKLGRTKASVQRKRDMLGLKKPGGRPTKKAQERFILENPTISSMGNISKDRRLEFYKENFADANIRYTQLCKELDEEELEYYKTRYISFIDSVDTLHINEEDMLHHMIMSDIVIHRIRSTMKREQDAWDNREEGARPPQALFAELERAEQRYMKYHRELNLTREQRLKKDREEKINIASLVRSFQDKHRREESGRQAAAMEYNKKKCREDMSKFRYLLGD